MSGVQNLIFALGMTLLFMAPAGLTFAQSTTQPVTLPAIAMVTYDPLGERIFATIDLGSASQYLEGDAYVFDLVDHPGLANLPLGTYSIRAGPVVIAAGSIVDYAFAFPATRLTDPTVRLTLDVGLAVAPAQLSVALALLPDHPADLTAEVDITQIGNGKVAVTVTGTSMDAITRFSLDLRPGQVITAAKQGGQDVAWWTDGPKVTAEAAPGAPIIFDIAYKGFQEFYIIGDEGDIMQSLQSIEPQVPGGAGPAQIRSKLSIVTTQDFTIIYLDEHEDGYDFDPNNPMATADNAYLLNIGDVLTLDDSEQYVGGSTGVESGDRLFVMGAPITVVRIVWPDDPGTYLAGSWELQPIQAWDTTFVAPIGSADIPLGGQAFLFIEALQDGTQVIIDDPIGGLVGPFTLDQGDNYRYPGLTWRGAEVTASGPIQAAMITGHVGCCATRYLTLNPSSQLDTEFLNPVTSGSYAEFAGDFPTDLYVYALEDSTEVWIETKSGTTYTVLNAGDVYQYTMPMPPNNDTAARVYTIRNPISVFMAHENGGAALDWGAAMLPASRLATEYYLPYAPANPVYLTPLNDNTEFFIDWDADDQIDVTFVMDRLDTKAMFPPASQGYDGTGAHIWASDVFSAVWGQDHRQQTPGEPLPDYDYGYQVIPVNWLEPVLGVDHLADHTSVAALTIPVNLTIRIATLGGGAVDDLKVESTLPQGWDYLPGTAVVTLTDLTAVPMEPAVAGQILTWDLGVQMPDLATLSVDYQAMPNGLALLGPNLLVAKALATQGFLMYGPEGEVVVDVLAPGSGAGAGVISPQIKELFLKGDLSLSRVAPSAPGPAAGEVIPSGFLRTWTLTPTTYTPVGHEGQLGAYLWLGSTGTTVDVRVLFNGTLLPMGVQVVTGGPIEHLFSLAFIDEINAAGQPIQIFVINSGAAELTVYRDTEVHPSRLELNTTDYIRTDSVQTLDTGMTPASSFLPGDDVVVHAELSDPFGNFDIAGATLSILNETGVPLIQDWAMNLTSVPANSDYAEAELTWGPLPVAYGDFTASVTSIEGNGVTHTLNATFRVSPYGLAITPTLSQLTVLPGTQAHHPFTVENLAVIQDTIALSVSPWLNGWGVELWWDTTGDLSVDTLAAEDLDGDGWWEWVDPLFAGDPGSVAVDLAAGGIGIGEVRISVPPAADLFDIDGRILTATSTTDLLAQATAEVLTRVLAPAPVIKELYLHRQTPVTVHFGLTTGEIMDRNPPGTMMATPYLTAHDWYSFPTMADQFHIIGSPQAMVRLETSSAQTINAELWLVDITGNQALISMASTFVTGSSWSTFTFSSLDTIIPEGDLLRIRFMAGSSFRVVYDSPSFDSRLELPTDTYIRIEQIDILDDIGLPQTIFDPLDTVKVRARVSDPFGTYDILAARLTMARLVGGDELTNVSMTKIAEDPVTPPSWADYELSWVIPISTPGGTYRAWVTGVEGNLVTDMGFSDLYIRPGDPAPELTNLTITPFSAQYGDPTSFSVDAQDNSSVVQVLLEVTDPFGGRSNVSMVPGGPPEYTYSATYLVLGTYSARVWAQDDIGTWNASAYQSFEIRDGTPPGFFNLSAAPDPGAVGNNVNLTLEVVDELAVDQVRITIIDPLGGISQYTPGPVAPPGYLLAFVPFVPGTYQWYAWANDSLGNGNTSALMSFQVLDPTPPGLPQVVATPAVQTAGGVVTINATVLEPWGLDSVWAIVTDPLGVTINITLTQDGPDSWVHAGPYFIPGTHTVIAWALDLGGNLNFSAATTFLIQDDVPPTLFDLTATPDPQAVSLPVLLSVDATDLVSVSAVWVLVDLPGGGSLNISLAPVGGDTWAAVQSFAAPGGHLAKAFAIDPAGNLANGSVVLFTIIDYSGPRIRDPLAVPDPQEDGLPVTFSANLTDADGIAIATLFVTLPNATVVTLPMAPASGDRWEVGSAFGTLGIHQWWVEVEDGGGSGNASGIQDLLIIDTDPPVLINASATPDPQENGGSVTLSVEASDLFGIGSVTAYVWYPNGSLVDILPLVLGGGSLWGVVSSFAVVGNYTYTFLAVDSPGNLAWSANATFSIVDTDGPWISNSNAAPDPAPQGIGVTISADVADDIALAWVVVAIGYPNGSYSSYPLSPASGFRYEMTQAFFGLGSHSYQIKAADWNDNRADGPNLTFVITDGLGPIIDPHQAAPDPQAIGGTVTISATITDPSAVTWVRVRITDPGNFVTYRMMSDLGGGNYQDVQAYFGMGIYDYLIEALDALGNLASAGGNFVINNPVGPALWNLTVVPTQVEPGGAVNVSVEAWAGGGLNGVYLLVTYPDSSTTFDTMTTGGGTLYWRNITYSMEGIHEVEVWAIDSTGKQNVTGPGAFLVIDDTAPTLANLSASPDPVGSGSPITIRVEATDGGVVSAVWALIDLPGGGTSNLTMSPTAFPEWLVGQAYVDLGIYWVNVTAIDGSGNLATIGPVTFSVVDVLPPVMTGASATPANVSQNGNVTLAVNVTDDFGPLVVWAQVWDPGGGSLNLSLTESPADHWSDTSAYAMIGNWSVTFYSSDGAGNPAAVGPLTFTVTAPPVPPPLPSRDIPIIFGWNLIALPVAVTGDPLAILNDSAGDGATTWERAFAWDATGGKWLSVDVNRPAYLNDLVSIDATMGIWLKVTATGDGYLTVTGANVTGATILLRAGWNLVGHPTMTDTTVGIALATVPWEQVAVFDNTTTYNFAPALSTTPLAAAQATWIRTSLPAVWNVPP